MAHIVCATQGRSGLLYSSFELVRRLEGAGHRVTYLTRSGATDVVEAQGFSCKALPDASELAPRDAASTELRWWEGLRTIQERRQQAANRLQWSAFADTLRTLDPDGLLIDIELHPYIITAVPMGIPTALLSPFFTVWKRPGVPPLHKSIVPGSGWRGHWLGIEWAWLRFRIGKLLSRVRNAYQSVGADDVSVLRHLARQTGFPFRRETARYHWLLPFTYRTLPVLCLNALEFDFPHDPHPSVHYVGPMIHRQRTSTRIDPEERASLESLITRRRASAGQRPLLVVLCSTFASIDVNFVERILHAASHWSDWDVILSLGGHSPGADLGARRDNVHAFSWVPVLDLLPHADVVVTNAGINTINECLRFGVPPVVYSLGTNDQPGNAARVASHGVGVVGDLETGSAEELVSLVEQARTDPEIRSNIEQMRDRYLAYEDEQRAVDIVEEMIE